MTLRTLQPLIASRDGSRIAGLAEVDAEATWVATSELLNRGVQGGNRQSAALLYVGDGRWIPITLSPGAITL